MISLSLLSPKNGDNNRCEHASIAHLRCESSDQPISKPGQPKCERIKQEILRVSFFYRWGSILRQTMLTLTENQTNIKHSELETYLRLPPLLSSFHLFYLLSQILHAYYFSLNQNFQPKQRVGKGTLLFAHTSGLVKVLLFTSSYIYKICREISTTSWR
jgi:hypothetical protein